MEAVLMERAPRAYKSLRTLYKFIGFATVSKLFVTVSEKAVSIFHEINLYCRTERDRDRKRKERERERQNDRGEENKLYAKVSF